MLITDLTEQSGLNNTYYFIVENTGGTYKLNYDNLLPITTGNIPSLSKSNVWNSAQLYNSTPISYDSGITIDFNNPLNDIYLTGVTSAGAINYQNGGLYILRINGSGAINWSPSFDFGNYSGIPSQNSGVTICQLLGGPSKLYVYDIKYGYT